VVVAIGHLLKILEFVHRCTSTGVLTLIVNTHKVDAVKFRDERHTLLVPA